VARRGGREEEDGKGRGGAEHKGHNRGNKGKRKERGQRGEKESEDRGMEGRVKRASINSPLS